MTIAEIDEILETIEEMQSTPTSNGNTSGCLRHNCLAPDGAGAVTSGSNNVRPADLSHNIADVRV